MALPELAVSFLYAADREVALMPRAEDYAHMWWAEEFPSHTPEAPWRRVDQSVHGNDFWQADFDPVARRWRLTYTTAGKYMA